MVLFIYLQSFTTLPLTVKIVGEIVVPFELENAVSNYPPTLFIVIGAHLRTGRPTLTEFFTSLPRVEPWEKNKQ